MGGRDNTWRSLTSARDQSTGALNDFIAYTHTGTLTQTLTVAVPSLNNQLRIAANSNSPTWSARAVEAARALMPQGQMNQRRIKMQRRERVEQMRRMYGLEGESREGSRLSLTATGALSTGGTGDTEDRMWPNMREYEVGGEMYGDGDAAWSDEDNGLYEWSQGLPLDDAALGLDI